MNDAIAALAGPIRSRPALLLLPILVTAACGGGGTSSQQITRATAERLCAEEARQADGISGRVGVGAGSEGPGASANVTITNRILDPVPEEVALEQCVNRRLIGAPPPRGNGLTIGISVGGEL